MKILIRLQMRLSRVCVGSAGGGGGAHVRRYDFCANAHMAGGGGGHTSECRISKVVAYFDRLVFILRV